MAEVITPDPKFEEMRKRYYHAENVQFQLIESLKHREGVFIRLATERLKSITIRDIKMNAVVYFNKNAERYNLYQYPYNVYASLAKMPNLPMFSFNNVEKRAQMDEFNKHYMDYITSYDALFDIDNTDLRIAYATTAKVKQIFDWWDVPYTTTFSVVADTPVLVSVNGVKDLMPIKNAIQKHKEGNIVETLSINSNNNLCFSRVKGHIEHEAQVYEVRYLGTNIPIKISAGHSLMFLDANLDIVTKTIESVREDDYLITLINNKLVKPTKISIPVDYTFNRESYQTEVEIDSALMEIVGYYLGDGFLSLKHHQISFTIGRHKKWKVERLQSLIKQFMEKHPISDNLMCHIKNDEKHNKSVSLVHCSHAILHQFLLSNFGKYAHHKKLPSWIWELNRESILALLRGYSNTDGYFGKYSITIKSVSFKWMSHIPQLSLMKQICWLLKMNGIPCILLYEKNKQHILPQGTLFKGSEILKIVVSLEKLGLKENSKFSPAIRDTCLPTRKLYEVYLRTLPSKVVKHRADYGVLRKELASRDRIYKTIAWIIAEAKNALTQDDLSIINKYLNLRNADIGLTKIKSVTPTDVETVYDLSVEGRECFFMGDSPILGKNSGNKGWHLRISYDDFPNELKELQKQQLIDHIKLFAENFRTVHALYSIDLSIFDARRIAKSPYSVVYPYYFIALPLSDEEFNHFTLEYVSLPHWLQPENMRKLYKRGLLKRKGTPEGFGKLVKKYTTL